MTGRISWCKWYPSDFLEGVHELTAEQHAIYSTVLNLIYERDRPIKFDPESLARRIRAMRPSTARKAVEALLEMGKLTLTDDGFLSNERAENELAKRRNIVAQNTAAGEKSGKSRKKVEEKSIKSRKKSPEKSNDFNETPERTPNHIDTDTEREERDSVTTSPTETLSDRTSLVETVGQKLLFESDSQSTGNVVELVPKPTPPRSLDDEFADFWSAYPNRKAKQAARRAFDKARKSVTLDVMLAAVRRYADETSDRPEYRKHPATWLNAGCWNDEPAANGRDVWRRFEQAFAEDTPILEFPTTPTERKAIP